MGTESADIKGSVRIGDRVVQDATLSQGNRISSLILMEEDPHSFSQRLIENWGAVQKIGRGEVDQAAFTKAVSHITNPFAGEKAKSILSYPRGYKPSSVEEQVRVLLGHFDWLDTSHVNELSSSWAEYKQADGLYVVPKPSMLAAQLGMADYWETFGLLTEQGPLSALASQRKFTNYRAGQLEPERYRLSQSAREAIEALEATQSGDLLVFPAQTGKLYAGFSVRNARFEIEHASEPSQWPLPAYFVGWMIFANGHRITKYEHLVIDCSGDEYTFGPEAGFGGARCFGFVAGGLCCSGGRVAVARGGYGSASGFSR